MTMTDIEYSFNIIVGFSVRHRDAIDRIVNGPLDICGGGGLHPIHLATSGNRIRLLEIKDWATNGPDTVVGYMRFVPDIDGEYRIVYIEEFEIFREYRGKGYGRKFAKMLSGYKYYFATGNEANDVIPTHVDGTERFWIRALGIDHYVMDIDSECTDESGTRIDSAKALANIDKLCKTRKYSDVMTKFMHLIYNTLVLSDSIDDDIDDFYGFIRQKIEESELWKHIINDD